MTEEKQKYLQKEIVDAGYNTEEFIAFIKIQKENGEDINNWTLEELIEVLITLEIIFK